MEMKIPKKLKVGSVDYEVRLVEHCGTNDDFGLWRPQGIIEIASPALMPMWVQAVLSVSKLTSLSRFLTTLMRSVRLLSINSEVNALLY